MLSCVSWRIYEADGISPGGEDGEDGCGRQAE